MNLSLSSQDLGEYVRAQLNSLFPDRYAVHAEALYPVLDRVIDRLDYCFRPARPRRYNRDGQTQFNHLYSDQYTVFLWMLSNELYRRSAGENILDKIYCLNKALHSFDCIYSNKLPDVFMIVHGVGTVLGNGEYGNYFVAYQQCTVGQNRGVYPRLGQGVGLGAGASVLGNSVLGDGVSVGAGLTILDRSVDAGLIAVSDGNGGVAAKMSRKQSIAQEYFDF